MKIQITHVQTMFADARVVAFYDVLDDAGKVLRSGARDTTLADATKASVLSESQAQLDADLSLLVGATSDPAAITAAMVTLGEAKTLEIQARARAAKAELDAGNLEVERAAKAAAIADLDAQLAAKQAALADTLPAAAETKPGGVDAP